MDYVPVHVSSHNPRPYFVAEDDEPATERDPRPVAILQFGLRISATVADRRFSEAGSDLRLRLESERLLSMFDPAPGVVCEDCLGFTCDCGDGW